MIVLLLSASGISLPYQIPPPLELWQEIQKREQGCKIYCVIAAICYQACSVFHKLACYANQPTHWEISLELPAQKENTLLHGHIGSHLPTSTAECHYAFKVQYFGTIS